MPYSSNPIYHNSVSETPPGTLRIQRYTGVLAISSLFGFLPAFTNLKLGDVQPIDCALFFLTVFCVAKFVYTGFSIRIRSSLAGLLRSYCLLLLLLVALSVLDVRMRFFPLDNASLLKQPIILSLSKLSQLAFVLCGFLWLTNVFQNDRALVGRALNAYWLAGLLSSWYAVMSCLIMFVRHADTSGASILGAYLTSGVVRARGFFIEGGPFGVYLVSVFIAGLLRRQLMLKKAGFLNSMVLLTAFLLSSSKAGFFAALLLILYLVMSFASFRKKVVFLVLSILIAGAAATWLHVGAGLSGYFRAYENAEEQIAERPDDYNLVVGRVTAFFIVPRMIEAHPITGIGFGNYPLMRNDPLYLGTLPVITEVEDLPALGIPGLMAEMGVPATLWLLVLLFYPYWVAHKKATMIGIAALFQPVAHMLGVQLTFFYPWFISACSLAVAFWDPEHVNRRKRSLMLAGTSPVPIHSKAICEASLLEREPS